MKSERISIPVTLAELEIVKKLMKQEKRSKAFIAAMLFQDGLKLVENQKP